MILEENFFTLLDVPQQFAVDLKRIKQRFRALQRDYHPDRFVRSTPREQRLAVQMSAHLNTALATLENPVSRAMHLLALQGIPFDQQQNTIRDPEFLMRQMELRESIESVAESNDSVALQALVDDVAESFAHSQSIFSDLFERFSASFAVSNQGNALDCTAQVSTAEGHRQLIDAVGKMQFFDKLCAELKTTSRARRG